MVGMTKQRWSKLRPWVALAIVGLYLAVLALVIVSGGWHSPRAFSSLGLVIVSALAAGLVSQFLAERVTGPKRLPKARLTVFVLVAISLGAAGSIRVFASPTFDPVGQVLQHMCVLVSALTMITGWIAPVPRPAPAA